MRMAEQDGHNDRSTPLALLELEKRSRSHRLSTGPWVIFNNLSESEIFSISQTRLQWWT